MRLQTRIGRRAAPTAFVAGVVLAIHALGGAPGWAQEGTDLSGEWSLQVSTGGTGTTTPTVTLVQQGSTLSGQYSSELLGNASVTGTVSGDQFEFSFDGDPGQMTAVVTYSGTIGSEDAISGEVNVAGLIGGSFSGRRR